MANTKPFRDADDEAKIGLEIFDTLALAAERPAVNETNSRITLPADRADVNSTRSVEGLKNELNNAQAPAPGTSPHSRRTPKTKKSKGWTVVTE